MNERALLTVSVALGSAVGGVARWALTAWVQTRAGLAFPWGTFLVNASGALLLGFLARFALATPAIGPEMRLLLTTGLCGGYTTFSTFTYETAVLLEQGEYGRASTYVVASVLVALIAMFAGFLLARALLVARGRP
ncbi:MAG TPA: fluoride efflux transporter CrcB [Gemmatimonadaceae bacterium]|nr:fluoride efflux transporter CrcB [Gemmatimonadaceae bacterium]